MWEVILDAFFDTLKIFPFILLIYIVMELIESAKSKDKIEKALTGKGAPVLASILGVVPECGFAVAVAKLFDKGLIKIGTMIAAFIAVSDEGLIVLLSHGLIVDALILVIVSVVFGIIIGEVVNMLFGRFSEHHTCPNHGDCIECGKHHDKPIEKFLIHPFFHSVKTFAFILVFSEIIAIIVSIIGEDRLSAFLDNSVYFQPLFSAIVGLIPTCASSVLIAETYAKGILNFAGLLSGLCVNAGLGIIVLFKNKERFKNNLLVIAILFISALIIGYLALLFTV